MTKDEFYDVINGYKINTDFRVRNKAMFMLRHHGGKITTYEALAKRFGITRERVRQICMAITKEINEYK